MLQPYQVEELICLVSSMDRPMLIRQFSTCRASFPIDFTPEFLHTQPLERLQHIFVALCLHTQQLPEVPPLPCDEPAGSHNFVAA